MKLKKFKEKITLKNKKYLFFTDKLFSFIFWFFIFSSSFSFFILRKKMGSDFGFLSDNAFTYSNSIFSSSFLTLDNFYMIVVFSILNFVIAKLIYNFDILISYLFLFSILFVNLIYLFSLFLI